MQDTHYFVKQVHSSLDGFDWFAQRFDVDKNIYIRIEYTLSLIIAYFQICCC